jgi:23S rRNA (uracil1939-C5)-methyltransferase
MNDEAQRAAKAGIVRDALRRIARRDVGLPLVVQGPSDWQYRRRLKLALQRRGTGWVGGLHPYDNPSAVFDLQQCPISRSVLVDAWHSVRRLSEALPKVTALELSLRLLDDGAVAIVIIGGDEWPDGPSFASQLFADNADVREVWWSSDVRGLQCVSARPHADAATSEANTQDSPLRDDALSFVQINAPVAAMLRAFVFSRIVEAGSRHVVDAYAGSGLLTEQLARAGMTVTSIELDAHATHRAARRVHGLRNVSVNTGAVQELLPVALQSNPDVVVVNPPRRGLEPTLPALLNDSARMGARLIAYISCDPATLARDLSAMDRWRVADVRCFDMFPQTAHVETVCLLEPESE